MGGGGGSQTSYTYRAAVIIGLCEGQSAGIGAVWSGKSRTTLSDLGLTLIDGQLGQAPWGYLTTKHPSDALGYTGLALVAGGTVDLGSNAELPNLSFEMKGEGIFTGSSDAKPDFIVSDFLTNPIYGAGWDPLKLDSLTAYATYCQAAALFLSPAFTDQKSAAEHLAVITQATNSQFVWSQGKLKLIPYADASITGNGVTYVPDVAPIYNLTDDDFQADGDDPVRCSRIGSADAFNHVQIEFINRAKDYNIEIAEAKDQADIETNGLRTADPIQMHCICDAAVARVVAQLVLQRELYIRNSYEFKLGWRYCLLEPMDIVTITDTAMGLDQLPVQITEIEEDEDGLLTVKAEEYPYGVTSHAVYPWDGGTGYIPDYNVAPGNANAPVVFAPPYTLAASNGGQEVWLATSGGPEWGGCEVWVSEDGNNYTKAGAIHGAARHGMLSANLATGSTVDVTNTLGVDLTVSGGQLLSGTQADADNLNTLCYVDGEFMAYETATLTAANRYNLTYLQRGAYGSPITSHNSGRPFVRIDQAVFRYPYLKSQIGKQIYIKLASFNRYGNAVQSLASITPYTYTIAAPNTVPNMPTAITVIPGFLQNKISVTFSPPDDFQDVEVWAATTNNRASAVLVGTTMSGDLTHTGLAPSDVRYYWARIVNKFGTAGGWYPTSSTGGVQGIMIADPTALIKLINDSAATGTGGGAGSLIVQGSINGTGAVGINGLLVVDGSITARTVGANQIIASSANLGTAVVDTLQIKDTAVSVHSNAITGNINIPNSSTSMNIVSLTINSMGGAIFICYAADYVSPYDPYAHQVAHSISRDAGAKSILNAAFAGPVSGSYLDFPGAGNHTYTWNVSQTSYSGNIVLTAARIIILELKR